jgi:hypothetical protein
MVGGLRSNNLLNVHLSTQNVLRNTDSGYLSVSTRVYPYSGDVCVQIRDVVCLFFLLL